ncbi:hypothetical protein A7D00_4370 [Trichophyton violaceum]|uniref:Uncharacterized protein n=1 Tax=Trichophyton violaceum TaxID=34388 RepID=A0A178FH45_TRIVO|nr:hypothetical protein A7D00_4370 [Trichophyton violaceum]
MDAFLPSPSQCWAQCWGKRLKQPALPLPGPDGDYIAARDVTHVVQVLNVWDKGALIKVRTVTGEERIVYSPLLELEWMLWEAGSAKKNLPLDSKALNHNGTYGDGRKTIDDPETVERVEASNMLEEGAWSGLK